MKTSVYKHGKSMESIHSIERVLGGKTILKSSPKTANDWHQILEGGLPLGALDALKRVASLSDTQIATLVGISGKTLQRARSARQLLDSVSSDRLYRVARLIALASEVLDDAKRGIGWLTRAQPGLGGSIPLALMTTDAGCEQVEQLLLRIEHGVYT
ncbi:MAG: antitoxin Xre-like helix-turn-helix domain-containing protein [Burkholderiales bacterium]